MKNEKRKDIYLESIIENSPISIIAVDTSGKVALWNKAAEKTFGWKQSEIIDKPNFIIPEDLKKEFEDLLSKSLVGENVVDFRTKRKCKDGNLIDVSISTSAWRDTEGDVIGGIAQIIDISKKVKAEKELKKSQYKYSSLISNLPGMVFRCKNDNDWTMEFISSGCYELTGYYPEEIEGNKRISYNEIIHHDDRDKVWQGVQKALNEENHYEIIYRIIHKAEMIKWVWEKGKGIYDKKGNVKFIEGFINDITDRIKAEAELKESEERFRSIFEDNLAPMFLLDPDNGKIEDVNPAAEKYYGWNRDEILSMNINQINTLPPEEIKKEMENARNSQRVYFEFQHKRADGSVRDVEVFGSKIEVKGKEYLHSIVHDITDKKIAEEKFEHVHSLLYAIRNVNQLIVAEKNIDTLMQRSCEILKESRGYSTIWISLTNDLITYNKFFSYGTGNEFKRFSEQIKNGMNPGCLTGLSLKQPVIKSDSIEEYCADCLMLPVRKDNGHIASLLYHLDRIYGVLYIVSKKIDVYSEEEESLLKEVSGDLGLAMYIHEEEQKRKHSEILLKESEEKFRSFVENAFDGVYLMKEIHYEYVNKKFYELTGYTEEELTSKDFDYQILLTENSLEIVEQRYHARKNGEDIPKTYEMEIKRKDGKIKYVEISTVTLGRKDELTILGFMRDVTEKRKMLEEIIIAKDKAEKSDKIKSEFLAQMSHEIRSPLNAVLNFTNLIKEETEVIKNEDLELSFAGIDSASKRIIRTIDLILNMTDLQIGTYLTSTRKINLAELLKHLIKDYEGVANGKKLELIFDSTFETAEIETDDYAVNQIFVNLIDNAIKYTHKGFVKVRLHSEDYEKYIVEIKDSGIGISEEYMPKLYTEFSQEEHGYSRKFEGNGLGMALVKKYCEIIGANISVKSKKDVGTTFTVKLK